jgi:polar amino acid transport system ATP-binding protein/sulfate transport system ATP-binding protein
VTVPGSSVGEVVLHVEDVHLKLGDTKILDGVSFEVKDRIRAEAVTGQIVALLGPSGVGKTRLLRIIAGLDAPDKGSVSGLKKKTLDPGTVGVVFQDYPLLKHRTAESNMLLAGSVRGLTAEKSRARCKELLDKFGLEERRDFYPAQLSGGQRQRLAIAQQLVVPTSLLLLDEPFSGLDPVALEDVSKLIVDVANMDEFNTLVVVTHDIRAAMSVSDTLFMLGRDLAADGKKKIPGAKIVAEYDLVERDLAWQPGLLQDPRFVALEKEIREKFRTL